MSYEDDNKGFAVEIIEERNAKELSFLFGAIFGSSIVIVWFAIKLLGKLHH